MGEEAGPLEKEHEAHRDNRRCFMYQNCDHLFLHATEMIMVNCSCFFGCSDTVLTVGTCVRKGLFTSWWPGKSEENREGEREDEGEAGDKSQGRRTHPY